VTAELLRSVTGIPVTIVPHRATAEVLTSLLRGDTQIGVESYAALKAPIDSGQIRAIAASGDKRSAMQPNVPTLKESGIDVQSDAWNALVAPGGTPPSIIATVNAELRKTLGEPAVIDKLKIQLIAPAPSSPEQLRQKITDEKALWADVIRAANIRIE